MCEYCGCQQIATIAELTREHDAVVALVGQIKAALPDRRRDDVVESCQQILAILAPHTVVEEDGLFPEMSAEFPDHISVLRAEHREIEKVLGEAADGFPDDRTTSEFRALTRGRNASEVLRELIHQSYLTDFHARAVADAERLSNDPEDRAELAAIAEEMNEIRTW